MSQRPFRHLCPEADKRDAMTEDEFWARVLRLVGFESFGEPDVDPQLDVPPCSICGEPGACGYDAEGRALIHATEEEEL